jgi:ribosomal protein S18 acetylase RimI-like enzyme
MYSAICGDSLKDDRLTIVVAVLGRDLLGFSVTISDWKRFWMSFWLHHPLLSLRIIFSRCMGLRKALAEQEEPDVSKRLPIEDFLSPISPNRSWKDSSPHIAKIIYTGVNPAFRGMGIATGIRTYEMKLLSQRGVRRFDGWVNPSNLAAIQLNSDFGFRIERHENLLFVTIDIE